MLKTAHILAGNKKLPNIGRGFRSEIKFQQSENKCAGLAWGWSPTGQAVRVQLIWRAARISRACASGLLAMAFALSANGRAAASQIVQIRRSRTSSNTINTMIAAGMSRVQ